MLRRLFLTVVVTAALAGQLAGSEEPADSGESAGSGESAAAVPFEHMVIDAGACGHRQVADINGDGLNDIVAVDFAGDDDLVLWYEFPGWTRHIIARPAAYGDFRKYRSDDMEAADIDGDGDMDIVGRVGPNGDGNGIVVWWENPLPDRGAAELWVRHDIGNTDYVKDLEVADFDLDGRPDVAAREHEETHIFVQESPGSWRRVQAIKHPSHEGMAAGDLDGDGDTDLVLNGFWLENPHPAKLETGWHRHSIDRKWWTQKGHGWKDNNSNVATGGIDGDGRLDVLLSSSELPGYPVSWYGAEDPKAGPWTEHRIEDVFDYCQTLQAADVDQDGDTDVLAAEFPRYDPPHPVVLYLNEGRGKSWSRQELSDRGMYHGGLGDLGSDGDIDIIGLRNYDSPPIEIWENQLGQPTRGLDRWTYILVDDSRAKWGDWDAPRWSKYFGLAMGDLTGDGFGDIVSGRYFYRNPGGDMSGKWARVDLGINCDASLIMDVDGDELADVIAPAGEKVYWLEAKDRSCGAWQATVIDSDYPKSGHGNPQGYRTAQVVPGGREEVLLNGEDVLCYEVPDDPSAGEWPRKRIVKGSNGEGIGLGDIDGDGLVDVAVAHHARGQGKDGPRHIKWCRNPGDGSGDWPGHDIGTTDARFPDRIAVADVNGDGRPDIIVTEEAQPVRPGWKTYWFEAPGDPAQGGWKRHVIVSQHTTNSMDVADMDGDADTDIVLGEHRGTMKLAIWENDGAGKLTEHVIDTGKESHLGARVFDLDGDGDLEVVSICWDDYRSLHLWRNDNAGAAKPGPHPPRAYAGPDRVIALPAKTVELAGVVRDGGEDSGPAARWTRESGPGPVGFKDKTSAHTVATFRSEGQYVLRLTAEHGGLSTHDEMTVTVVRAGADLVLHWPFDGDDEGSAGDASPYDNDGEITAARRTEGQPGNALLFDGHSSYVSRPNRALHGTFPSSTLSRAGDFTVAARVKLASTGHRNPVAGKQGDEQRGFMFMTESDDRLTLELFKNASEKTTVSSAARLEAGRWYHVAATYEYHGNKESRIRLYIDGLPDGSADNAVGPVNGNSTAFQVGRYYWSRAYSVYFDGLIDEVRVYNRALTPGEIKAISGTGH